MVVNPLRALIQTKNGQLRFAALIQIQNGRDRTPLSAEGGGVVQRHGASGNPFKDLAAKSGAHSGAAIFDAWRRACHAALPAALD